MTDDQERTLLGEIELLKKERQILKTRQGWLIKQLNVCMAQLSEFRVPLLDVVDETKQNIEQINRMIERTKQLIDKVECEQ